MVANRETALETGIPFMADAQSEKAVEIMQGIFQVRSATIRQCRTPGWRANDRRALQWTFGGHFTLGEWNRHSDSIRGPAVHERAS